MRLRRASLGLSIIELMVSIVVGLIVVSGVTTVLVNSLQANNEIVRASRLNQELRAVMDLMTRDLRRGGYRGNYASFVGKLAAGSTYSNTVVIAEGGTRVDFSYDADGDGSFGAGEAFAYRLSSGVVQMLRNDAWVNLTDTSLTEVTELAFCFVPSDDDECLTAPPAAGTVTVPGSSVQVIVKELRISLTGRVRNDTAVVRTLRETVRVRNDEVVNPGGTP